MLFLLLHEHQTIKSLIPLLVSAGTLPSFAIIWTFVRIVTLFLPRNFYRKSDDYLYQMYQKQNIFFLENLTGIKVLRSLEKKCIKSILSSNFFYSFFFMAIIKSFSMTKIATL
jgi:hypothetical protein